MAVYCSMNCSRLEPPRVPKVLDNISTIQTGKTIKNRCLPPVCNTSNKGRIHIQTGTARCTRQHPSVVREPCSRVRIDFGNHQPYVTLYLATLCDLPLFQVDYQRNLQGVPVSWRGSHAVDVWFANKIGM